MRLKAVTATAVFSRDWQRPSLREPTIVIQNRGAIIYYAPTELIVARIAPDSTLEDA